MENAKFVIICSKRPRGSNLNEELQWLGGSLGLFSLRDKDKSCFRIFISLLKDVKKRKGLSSDDIAEQTGLSRGTVVHHLNRLINNRIVMAEDNRYVLTVGSLAALIDSIEKDIDQSLSELRKMAREIDRRLEF